MTPGILVTHCAIRCDADGCTAAITLTHDVDDTQAAAIARAANWTAQMGALVWRHHCPRHSEVKR